MRWIQWKYPNGPSRIHATVNGRVTLCSKLVFHSPILNSQTKPSDGKSICKLCQKAEEEGRRYQ